MALKLYDKIVPSDEFALVDAEHVEMADGSNLSGFATRAAEQAQDLTERVTALEEQADQMGSVANQAIGQLASLTGRVTALETPAVSVDLTAFESAGTVVETHADGSAKTYTMEFDEDGNPTKVTDSDGNVTVLTW